MPFIADPIADMLTRIRNAGMARQLDTTMPSTKVLVAIAKVLRDEGYIAGYDVIDDGRQGQIRVKLKYGPRGEVLIHKIERQSKPGRRVYSGVETLPRPIQGLGIAIVSTSKGVLSDRKCRTERVGGELLAVIE